jgi:hypothetical protein
LHTILDDDNLDDGSLGPEGADWRYRAATFVPGTGWQYGEIADTPETIEVCEKILAIFREHTEVWRVAAVSWFFGYPQKWLTGLGLDLIDSGFPRPFNELMAERWAS